MKGGLTNAALGGVDVKTAQGMLPAEVKVYPLVDDLLVTGIPAGGRAAVHDVDGQVPTMHRSELAALADHLRTTPRPTRRRRRVARGAGGHGIVRGERAANPREHTAGGGCGTRPSCSAVRCDAQACLMGARTDTHACLVGARTDPPARACPRRAWRVWMGAGQTRER